MTVWIKFNLKKKQKVVKSCKISRKFQDRPSAFITFKYLSKRVSSYKRNKKGRCCKLFNFLSKAIWKLEKEKKWTKGNLKKLLFFWCKLHHDRTHHHNHNRITDNATTTTCQDPFHMEVFNHPLMFYLTSIYFLVRNMTMMRNWDVTGHICIPFNYIESSKRSSLSSSVWAWQNHGSRL